MWSVRLKASAKPETIGGIPFSAGETVFLRSSFLPKAIAESAALWKRWIDKTPAGAVFADDHETPKKKKVTDG